MGEIIKKEKDFGFIIFEKGQILRPFQALSKNKSLKGMLYVYRGIDRYNFQFGLFGGGVQLPSLWVIGRENRLWVGG